MTREKEYIMSIENWEKCTSMCDACPFAFTEISEQAQNYGCLPSPYEIFSMMKDEGANWSCHEKDGKMCSGFLAVCRDEGVSFKGKPMFRSETYLRTGEKLVLS